MKQLSKLRNIATRLAFFSVMAVAVLVLSPKAFGYMVMRYPLHTTQRL